MEYQDFEVAGLAARRWGQGKPCLALHGWMDNAATWDRLAPMLPGLELVCLDLPGHGRSPHRHREAFYHFVDWIPAVLAAAHELGWTRYHLLGHSMGAGIASLVAGTVPSAIERMVLVEGLGPFTSPESDAPALLRRSLGHRLSGRQPVYPDFEAAVARLQSRGLSRAGAEALAGRSVVEVAGGVAFRYDPRLRTPSRARLTEGQIRAFLSEITAPTLLVLGQQGLDIPDQMLGQRAEVVADLEVVKVEGGHHLHLDNPQAVAPLVKGFLGL
ncbi:MAG: alpha/beta hydrolase [Candidatus Eremiobacteraeota bacterium]|nr:alpha/beta hydrolase [Candidatus Eremiobacteraeota bacterium]